jgi:glycosyltransferase involved in cell wall biosynthesis
MKISFLDDEPEIFPMQYGGKARTIINIAKTFSVLPNVDKVSILSRSIRSKEKEFIWNSINFKKIVGYGMVRDILNEINECDILNVHTCSFTMPYLSGKGAKLVNHLHDVILATSDFGSHLDKAMGNKWSAIISPSEFATTTLSNISWWSNLRDSIYTIPRGVDLKMFFPINNKQTNKRFPEFKNFFPILLFPNRYDSNKGELFLPELAKMLKKKYPNVLILTTNNINDKIYNKGVIRNIGWISSKDMRYYYSLADILLNLSLAPESFSQVAVESIACGTPVVCFKFGNLKNLSEKIPSIKSCEPNKDDLYNIVNMILEGGVNGNSEMSQSRDIINKNYNLSIVCQSYIANYKKIIEAKERPFVLATKAEMNKERFAVSPLIAAYNYNVYLNSDGCLSKFTLTELEKKVLAYCSIVKTKNEIITEFKKYNNDIRNVLNKLANKNILIKV